MAKKKTTPSKKGRERNESQLTPETFANALKLKSIRIVESNSKLSISAGIVPKESYVAYTVNVGSIENTSTTLGNVIVNVTSNRPDESVDPKKSHFAISFTVQCVYECTLELDKANPEIAKRLITTTVMAAWPYARMLVHSLSTAMGLPPITLPLYSPHQNKLTIARRDEGNSESSQ